MEPMPSPTAAAGTHDGSAPYAAGSITLFQNNYIRQLSPQYSTAFGYSTFRVLDGAGVPIANEIVTIACPTGTGPSMAKDVITTRSWTVTTDVNGICSVGSPGYSLLAPNNAVGQWIGTATPNSNTGISASFQMTNQLAPIVPTRIVAGGSFSSWIQTAEQGATFGSRLAVVVSGISTAGGGSDTGLSGYSLFWALENPPAGATIVESGGTNYTVLSAGGGNSNIAVKAGAGSGSFIVYCRPSDNPSGPITYFYLTVVVSTTPAALTKISGDGQSAVVNVAFGAALVAQISNGVGVGLSGQTITFTAPASGASCSFSGSNVFAASSNVNGQVTTPVPVAGSTVGSYLVTVSSPGVPNITFSLSNAAPATPQDRNDGLTYCEM